MKNNIFKHIFLAVAVFIGLASCADREVITVEPQSAPIVMDLSAETLFLDSNFPNNQAITITWDRAGYSVPVEVKYQVELSDTESFENKTTLPVTNEKFVTLTNKELNEKVKEIGLQPYVEQKLYFRVISFLGGSDLVQTSNVSSIAITPYLASPTYTYTDYYMIGSATAADWDNSSPNLIPLHKTDDSNKYTFTGLLKAGAFKMIRDKGSWTVQFGKGAEDGQLSTDGGSGDIPVAEEGYYTLTIDTSALTYTLVKIATPTTPVYDSVSIIGTVNGDWNNDTQLVKSAHDPHLWTLMGVSLNDGEFKFRANNAWDMDWGTNAEWFGTATKGGSNIPLSATWTYNIYFNDVTGQYTIIPVK